MTKSVVCVYMGQAAVADLRRYSLYSGQFSSCCPIVMFNNETKRAGYYHMPGKTNLQDHAVISHFDPQDEKRVSDMAETVKPTKVWIFPGKSVRSIVGARDAMQAAFNARPLARNLGNVALDIPDEQTGSLAVSLNDQGEIVFSPNLIQYAGSVWYDSKRDINKRPDGQEVLFWKWGRDVRSFVELS